MSTSSFFSNVTVFSTKDLKQPSKQCIDTFPASETELFEKFIDKTKPQKFSCSVTQEAGVKKSCWR